MRRIAALLLVPALAHAEAPPVEVETLELDTMLDLDVASATKSAQPLSASPAVGAVATRDQLEDFPWLSLNDFLFTQPGFFPSQDYERRTVGARGEREDWNNNRLLLLIDGLPQNDVETGTAFTWEATPLFLAERVEALRGPGSALYGSYALNGVIAVDTVSAADLGGAGARARFRLGADTRQLDVLAAGTTKWVAATVAYSSAERQPDAALDYDGSGRLDTASQLARFPIYDDEGSTYAFAKLEGRGPLAGWTLSLHDQAWSYTTQRGWLYWAPDRPDDMNEARRIASLKYHSPGSGPWTQEYAVQVQRHSYNLRPRLYPDGAVGGIYPAGLDEVIETDLEDLFARAQVARELPAGASALVGAEYTVMRYGGDRVHTASANPDDGTPFAGEQTLGGIYQPIQGHPMSKLGVFAQLESGRLLGERLALTAGARFDDLFFDYTDLATAGTPTRSKSFANLSPRLALVVRPAEALSLKLMAGRAFRTPTPVELFSANTWTSSPAASLAQMGGESQTLYELAADWKLGSGLRLRANAYVADLDGSIGYDVGNDHIINRFDDERAGFEAELGFDTRLGAGVALDGWASWSFVTLLGEESSDPGVSAAGQIVRAPAHMVKAGARVRRGRWTATVEGLWQGEVERRAEDLATPLFRDARPVAVPAWLTLDAAIHFAISDWLRLGVEAQNLLGSDGRLPAPGDLPFDYRVAPRRVLGNVELRL